MVTIPTVENCFLLVVGYRACLMEWALVAVCFSCCVKVDRLEVDRVTGFAILFWVNYHMMASCHNFNKGYILIEVVFHLLLPL